MIDLKLLVLDRNTWNHLIVDIQLINVWELLVLDGFKYS